MAFIEGSRGNVLFTGDFRLPLNCAARLPFLKDSNPCSDLGKNLETKTTKKNTIESQSTKIKSVDNLYVDMTFFKPEICYIPTREESVKKLLEFLHSFLDLNNCKRKLTGANDYFSNLVYFKTSARIGYEYVYQEIYNRTGFKVHVNDLIFKIYEKLPQIQACLTTNPYETPIHSCIYENRKRDAAKTDLMSSALNSKEKKAYNAPISAQSKAKNSLKPLIPCLLCSDDKFHSLKVNAVKVILSAMWFTDTAGVDQIFIEYKPPAKDMETMAYKPYKKCYRLCFSFHSSFEEIVNFVNTLRPKRIYSIALPESTTDQIINEYFYSSGGSGEFIGFHNSAKAAKKESINKQIVIQQPSSCITNKKLLLRKRNSNLNISKNSSSEDLSNTDHEESDNSLNFGSTDGEEDCTKKKKLKC
jgi:hypothetical protein